MRAPRARWQVQRLHIAVILAAAVMAAVFPMTARAQLQAETLYVNTSASGQGITSESNSHGAPDGNVAYISGNLANGETWTFDFDATSQSTVSIDSARILVSHYQSGWIEDSLVLEYYDGTSFIPFEEFANIPTSLSTTGPYTAANITSGSQLDGFQVQMRGVLKIGPGRPDGITYYVDAIQLQVFYAGTGNNAPVLTAIGAQSVDEGQNLNIGITGSDADGDSLILSAENVPTNATFTDNFDGTGTFDFTPDFTQAGVYNVTFIVSDGALADTEIVAITVNDVNRAPTLASIGSQSVDENQNLNFGVSGSDADGDSLILSAENVPTNATFTDNFDGTGTFDFTPDFTQAGVYNVTFIVSDGALADTEIVAITVNDVNRAPTLASIGSQSVDEGQNLNIGITGSDADGDSVILSAENVPTNASFTDNFDGTGTFDFTPDFTQAGVYNVTFIASDGALADTEIVAITVNDVNRAPTLASIGSQSVDENQNLNFGVSGSDADGDSLILSAENVPTNASFTDNFDGTGTFDFTPDFTQAGVYNVTFIVSDGALADTEIVAITVNDVNRAPTLASIGSQSVDENQNLNFGVSGSDADGDSLILSAENVPTNASFTDNFDGTGTFDFTPDFTQAGVYNVTFIVSDGALADTEIVAITVNDVNRAPTLASIGAKSVNEGQNLNFMTSASDPDGDSLIWSAENLPANATFADQYDGTGIFNFNPDYTQAGVYNVTFIVSDGALADTETVEITAEDVDQAPVLDPIGDQSVDENQNLNFGISASDADGDSIVLSAENIPANATFTDNFDGTGTFDFNPDFMQAGVYSVRFIATAGGLADTELVGITVNDVNRAPALASIGSQSVDEGQNLNFGTSASDLDGDSLILSAENLPANATYSDNFDGTGTFDFNPDFTQAGVYNVSFIASDGALADTELVAITVNDVNQAPVLASIGSQSVDEGQNLNFGVSASDFDNDSLILSAENIPTNATFTDNFDGTGTFDFNPDFTQAGVYNVTFIASDGALADTELVAITVNDVNQAPVLASIGSKSVDEGQNLNFGVSGSDPDGDSVILSADNIPANATFSDNFDGTGSFDFTPDFSQAGVYNVSFIVSDGALADTEIVAITVNDVNRAPTLANIGSQTIDEGQNLNFGVSGSDPDGDSLIFFAENVPANATFTDNFDGTGTFDFTPDFSQAGVYNVSFIVSDGELADTEIVAITVNNINQAPVLASIGSQTFDEGQNLNFGVSGSDADGDSLILSAENIPTNATFTDNFDGTGTFDFTPDFSQAGVYNVTFIATDGALADTEIVAITVNDVNRAPTLASIGSQSVDEGQNLNFGVSGSDADGDSLILSAENIPTNATFTDNFDGTGTFDFNPDFTQAGVYNVAFIASDGALADTEIVAITVNDVNQAPTLANIGSQTVDEGQNLNFGVSSSDPDGDSLIFSAENVPANATFTDNFDGTGTFDFTPDFSQAGVYNVTFIATDGALADTEIVAITVNDVNQAPVLASIGSKSVDEGQNLNFGVSASDVDNDSLVLTAENVPANATFTDNFDGTGTFDFNPDFTQAGVYNVSFIVSDGELADTEIVAITVNDVNQGPVLAAIGSKTVDEGQNLNFGISASDFDNDSLILSAENVPTNATFTDNFDGTGTFDFSPDFTQAGIYNVTFIVSDGALVDTEIVAITVNDVNVAPELASIGSKTVDEGQTLNFGVSASDLDNDSLILSAENIPVNATFTDNFDGTGTFDFNPDFTQSGVYNVRFIASDGALADTELVEITVNHISQPPTLNAIGSKTVDEGDTLNFGVSGSDPDGDSLILTAEDVPANATFTDNLDGTGTFDFTPDFSQAGVYNVRFIVSDGGLADTELVAITVNDVNRAPTLATIGSQSVDEGQSLNVGVSGSDPDGDSLILSAENVPANATFTDNFDGTGTFDFAPDFSQAGVYNVTFIASDGVLSDTEIVAITVNDVNQAPVLASIGSQTVDEGQNLNFGVSASDVDNDSLVLTAENVPANATFTDNFDGTGTFDFNPDSTQAGVYNVRFIASDGALADTELVEITVTQVNLAPSLAAIGSQTVDEGQDLNFGVSGSDPDGDSLILTAENVPTNATFTDNFDGTGTFDFSPDFSQAGVYNVRFIVSDGALSDTELVEITVNDVNGAPVLASIGSKTVDEGQNLNFGVSASDLDNDSLILIAENVPTNATFTDNFDGTGTFDFNPDFTQSGVYNVHFIVSDGALADTELVAITVNDVSLPPVLDAIGSKSIDEGQNLNFGVSASDPDGDSLILTAEDVPANATFTDNFDGTGTFDFTPDLTQAGVYNVRFIVSDGGLADTELVAITVNDVNRAPTLASIGSQSVDEGSNLSFGVSASDPDGDSLILTAEDVPANATFIDNGDGTATFDFNPDFTQSGVYNVRFIASDGALADSELVQITVNDVPRAPVLSAIGAQSVDEGQNLNVLVTASDPDGDSLILTAEAVPTNATFTDNFDGTGTFDFTPDFTQSGVYNVRFIASDGGLADTELVEITVNHVNRVPVLASIGAKSVLEGENLNFSVSASDPDADSVILSAVNVPTNAAFTDNYDGTGTFDFNPSFVQSGTYDVTFIASDGVLADSEVVTITVDEAGNQLPILDPIGDQSVTEGETLLFRVHATDPEDAPLTLLTSVLPSNATFVDSGNGAGSFEFAPSFTQSDTFFITFIAEDPLGDRDDELVEIRVFEAGNQSPVLDPIGPQAVAEGDHLEFRVFATDPDGTTPSLSAANLPANAAFVDSANGAGGFTFDPSFGQEGVYNVLFIAADTSLADTISVEITVGDVNLAPELATIGSQTVDEGQNLNFNVTASDSDGDSLIFTAENVPTNATFTDNFDGTGTFDFNPDHFQSGVYNVRFIVSDGALADTELVDITVNDVNRAPALASIGSQTVDEGQNLNVGVSGSDPDGDSLIFSAEDIPANATFTDNFDGTGTFDFNPDFTQAGVYNVRFIVSDGALADTELVAVTVNDVNRAPTLAAIGSQSVNEGDTLTFGVSGSDPDGDSLILSALDVPANATFTDNFDGTGTFDFTPTFDQTGNYNVTFIVSDGVSADSEVVTITVGDVNRPPALATIGDQSVDENQNLNVGVSASDPDADSLILSAENLPANATFTDNFDGTGTFDFTPDFTQAGVYNVRFIASDGALADTELVEVTVNNVDRAPVLSAIGAQTVDEGQNLNVAISASDPDNDSLVLSAENLPTNATFTDNFDGTGTFDFTPDFTQAGVYTVRFIVTDGELADTELVDVTVSDVNQAPVLDPIDNQVVDEGQNLNFGVTASDFDGDSLILSAENLPANATFTDNFDGTGTFDFNPDFLQSGNYTVRFIGSDGALADTELVSITVNEAGNQRPVLASIGDQSVTEGQNLNFGVSATDEDLDSLILSAVNLPANATFTDNFDGTGTFDFNPNFVQAGVYNVTFVASDGSLADSEIVAITVNEAGNQSPEIDSTGSQLVEEGQNLNFNVSATDPDLDSLILSAEDLPVNATFTDNFDGTGTFDFNPDFTQSGVYNIRFIASDGSLTDTLIVEVTVNESGNQRPVLDAISDQSVDEGQNLSLAVSASDADLDSLILTAENVPANATFTDNFDGTGLFDFNPDYFQAGVYNVRFIVSDGALADTELVAITVNDVNRAPVLDAIGSQTVDEGQTLNLSISASDSDLDSLILSAENVPINATFTDNFDGTGAFSFSPDFTQSGLYNVRFIVTDGAIADTELVEITVNHVNRLPDLASIPNQSVDEGQNLNFGVSASDPDGDSLILTAVSLPVNATFTDNFDGTGTFDFNPDFDQAGIYDVDIIASDGALADTETVQITVSETNRVPDLASIPNQTVDEGQNLNIVVSATDPDNDSLILSAFNLPANAAFTDNFDGSGALDFSPDFTQSGVYNVSVVASDGALADTEQVQITVNHVNLAPVLDPIGSQSVEESSNLNVTVTSSDFDNDSLILSAENVPTNATFTDNFDGTGTFDFTPDFTQSGIYNVRFIVSDGALADTELVSITVTEAGNQRPVIDPIASQTVLEGDTLSFTATASDADGDSLILSAINLPANASFSDNFDGTGSFTFTPNFVQAGVYNISIIANDGGLADTENVEITVNEAGNQSPVFDPIADQVVDEGQNLNFGVSATDPDLDSLILSARNLPTNATFTDNFDGTGTFNFNPNFTQAGVYLITLIASDGAVADSEQVQITVNEAGNQAPAWSAILDQSVNEGQNLGFVVSASDPEGDSIILTAENVPTNATFTDDGDGSGFFNFDPDFTQAGIYSVRFIASDGALADTENVQITVNDVNRAPVVDPIADQSVDEGQNLNVGVTSSDPDGDSLMLSAFGLPVNATFTDNFNNTGTIDFNPDFDQAGVYNVSVVASDGVLADTESVQITVNHVNRAPVLDPISDQTVDEGQNLNVGVTSSDPDGDSLTLSAENLPVNATFTDNSDGTGTFDFNPDFTQAGVYSVDVIVSDGALADTQSFQITVNHVNLAPTLASLSDQSVNEGENLNFVVNSSDPDNDSLILTAENVPANATFTDNGDGTGLFDFTPDFDQTGNYTVRFIVSDGALADSQDVLITVGDVNRAPVVDAIPNQSVDEGQNLNFVATSSDPDGDSLILSALNVPTNATFTDNFDGTGTIDFNPDFDQSGVYNISIIASDGVLADTEAVQITVNHVNRVPDLAAIANQTVDEGQNLNFGVTATDPDNDSLILTAVSLPANATFTDNFNGTGTFDFNPDFDQAGVYNVDIVASDGALADTETVQITVNETNRVPDLAAIPNQTVDEGQNLNVVISALDPDGDSLILSAINLPTNATFTDNFDGTGALDFNPDFDQSGVYTVDVIASDGALADTESVQITVNHVNRVPDLASIPPQSVDEGLDLSFGVSATDPDGDTLSLSAINIPANASFTDNGGGNGTFDFSPDFTQSGIYTVQIIANDGALADTESVTITVNEANAPPVFDSVGAQSVAEGDHLEFRVFASDVDGTTPTLSAFNVPTNAAFADSGNGAGGFTFDPSFTQEGIYDVGFIATDGTLDDTLIVQITVTGENATPIADAGPDQGPVAVGAVVALDGTGSSDADGDSLGYHWTQVSGPSVVLSDSNAAQPSFTATAGGTIIIELIVDDATVVSATDSVTVTVSAKPNAIIDLNATVSGNSIQLNWTDVTTDTSGAPTTISRYVIYRGTRAYFDPTSADSIGNVTQGIEVFSDNNIAGANVVGDTGTNYFYCVEAVDVAGSRSELSNRVGEYDYQIYTTSTTDFSLITMPFAGTGITQASDLIEAIGTANVNTVSRYIASSQSYESRFAAGFGTNFAVEPGGVYQVNAKSPTVFTVAGRVPDSGTVSYQIETTSTTDFGFISIPFEYELTYTAAQDVIDAIPGVLNALSRFIPSSQSYESRFSAGFGTNFPVRPGRAYQTNAATSGVFPNP